MKKIILSICILTAAALTAAAIPANPRITKVRQPDGTMISLRLHGDEFCSWGTTPDGKTMMAGEDGFYRTVSPSRIKEERTRAKSQRSARTSIRKNAHEISTGNKKFLVILVNFSDLKFKKANEDFNKLMNQAGYSAYGGTGSVADYYKDQSSGKFNPTFDVIGPIDVSRDMQFYGKSQGNSHDANPGQMVKEAVDSIYKKGLVNFSDYDNDSDGYVDNIYVFYAGYSEASGGGANTIWPHSSWVNSDKEYDGVSIGSYACGSELKGNSGSAMDGIGTFCHEFGHVLGLPDFYDTDYEDNGEGDGLLAFSLMDSGCYNNNSNTPPNMNAIERNMLGWMDEIEYLTVSGHKTLRSIANNVSYIAPSENEGEFFLLEVRDGKGWDAHIYMSYSNGAPVGPTAAGLIVYHVDMSDNIVYRNYSARYLWEHTNSINCFADHQCFYVLPSY
ncbi:MAG: M6 family metalloprotease domain-containing protein, partial [Bacteroidales bacterium]|nr:M6 family metalloprotease domain-containing protein [Bacteroidales bacterium]